jgi:16S rRNA (cytosine1402-N4)-methyltransferase
MNVNVIKYSNILVKHKKKYFSKLNIQNYNPLYFEDHYPVLWREILSIVHENLYPTSEESLKPKLIGDFTIGSGNHTKLILDNFKNSHIVGVDLDQKMIEKSANKLAQYIVDKRLAIYHDNYSAIRDMDILEAFHEKRIFPKTKKFDMLLLDLGYNSLQLLDNTKGISFKQRDAELDMRYDTDNHDIAKANDILNNCSEFELLEIFKSFGEEKHAEPLVANILSFRETKHFYKVGEFIDVIDKSYRAKSNDIFDHYTRLFQALRIAVNYEIFNVKRFLGRCFSMVENNGIVAVITFHSVEDNAVKEFSSRAEKMGYCKILYKPGIKPSKVETGENSKSRSATLRVLKYTP